MKSVVLSTLSAALLAATAGAAVADGYLSIEGQAAFLFGAPVQMFIEGVDDDQVERWINVPFAYASRFAWGSQWTGPGGTFRLGAVLSGWHGANEGYEIVSAGRLFAHKGSDIALTIDQCFADPCVNVAGSLVRSYWEVMGEFFAGPTSAASAPSVSFGVQPFFGHISEQSDSLMWLGIDPDEDASRQGLIDASAIGGLAAIDLRLPLGSSRVSVLASGGLGIYGIRAAATTLYTRPPQPPQYEVHFSESQAGLRAQGGLGLAFRVSPAVEFSLISRADYWQAYPSIGWPSFFDLNNVLLSEEDDIVWDPLLRLTSGVGLTLHF